MSGNSDEDLVKGCIKGDRRYQELLYLKFSRKMMGVCYRYTKSQQEAEDLLQESFIRIYKKINQYRSEGSLEGWIRKVVLSTVFDFLRKQNLMIAMTNIETNVEEVVTDDLFPETDLELLVQTIRDLSPGYRAVFNLYVIEGYTHKEIGKILGISDGTSKSQYAMARRVLQGKLKQFSPSIKIK
jgi:RNA polymerase sigma factor (sigma-70 family)